MGIFFCIQTSLRSQCTPVTPSFTDTFNKSCGLPVTHTFTNTSTGTNSGVAYYSWFIDSTFIRKDTGLVNLRYTFTTSETYSIKLLVVDTGSSPCKDSATLSITISSIAPLINGGVNGYSHDPVWENCIFNPNSPDTFGITFEVNDTLKNYRIEWGDSANSVNTGTQLLSSQSIYFKYTKLGQFRIRIITTVNGCSDTLFGSVINERNPVASLQGPPSGLNFGCIPFTTRFINRSPFASPSTTFTWDMGDSTFYILPASTYNDTLYHTYRRFLCNGTVRLTATNACGSSTSTWSPIQMGDKDSAIMDIVNPTNCDLNTPFSFDNRSEPRYCVNPNPRRYRYVWGDGTSTSWTSSTTRETKSYTQRGTYTILLIDSNTCGIDTAQQIIVIDSLPTSMAFSDIQSGCTPLTVNFNAQSIGNLTSRSWNFGNPASGGMNTSTDSLPSHTYNSAGNYNAILSLTNTCGTVMDTIPIRAEGRVVARFDAISGGCFPYTFAPNNTSTEYFSSGTIYQWTLHNGDTSTSFNPGSFTINTPNTYTIKLVATDSCGTDSMSRTFEVYGKPPLTASIVSAAPCQRTNLELCYSTNNATNVINWFHDDGKATLRFTGDTAISHTYSFDSLRTYNNILYITDANGCRDTLNYPITVNPRPVSSYTITDSTGCSPLLLNTTNLSTHQGTGTFSQLSHEWIIDGIVLDTSANLNQYFQASLSKDSLTSLNLIVTNTYGCKDTSNKPLIIYPKPVSRFTENMDSMCAPLDVAFTNLSYPNDTGSIAIMTFLWDFGNGVTSNARDTQVQFQSGTAGDSLYIHGLIAYSEHNCADTSYSSTYVYPIPRVEFTLDNYSGCNPFSPLITNNSSPLDTGSIDIMSFVWNFGNGDTSTSRNPSVTYNDYSTTDSIYTIQLQGVSEHGCRDSSTAQITVYPSPISLFSPIDTSGCSRFDVPFTNLTVNGDSYSWIIENTAVDTVSDLQYSFTGKTYADSLISIRLTSQSINGCFGDTAQGYVRVLAKPFADFIPDDDTFCFLDSTQFLNQSRGAYSYAWDFGDGVTSSQINPLHKFQKSTNPLSDSTYSVNLIASGYNGCNDTSSSDISVYPYPIPDFSPDNDVGCSPMRVAFTNQSSNSVRFYWDFGDGTNSTDVDPIKTYDNRGFADTQFTVVLYAYTLDCVDTISQIITVHPKPLAFFNSDREQPCSNNIQFYNASIRASQVKYYFGDGDSSSQFDPLHTYPSSPYGDSSFTATLIATSVDGCKDTINRTIILPQKLVVGFKDTSVIVCPPFRMNFENRTVGAIGYLWDFGDGVGSADFNPSHIYTTPGVYRYSLKGFDATGCVDSMTSTGTITIRERPTALFDFFPKDLRINEVTLVDYVDQSTNVIPATYSWTFNDPNAAPGTNTSNLTDPSHNYTDSGNYTTRLILFNGGCYDTFERVIRIKPAYPVVDFTSTPNNGCAPLLVQFTNLTQYASTYLWQFGDGDTSSAFEPSHVYDYPGSYDVALIAYGPGGVVKEEKFMHVVVPEKPFAYFDIGPSTVYLPSGTLGSENGSSRAISYVWNIFKEPGKVFIASDTGYNIQYTPVDTGGFSVMLVAMNQYGCTDTFFRFSSFFVNPTGMIHIPNAFAPDGDGRNDIFRPIMLNNKTENYKFLVYNRWGEKVFETTDPNAGWDGTYQGKPCQTEVYAYLVRVEFVNGEEKTEKGVIHLLR